MEDFQEPRGGRTRMERRGHEDFQDVSDHQCKPTAASPPAVAPQLRYMIDPLLPFAAGNNSQAASSIDGMSSLSSPPPKAVARPPQKRQIFGSVSSLSATASIRLPSRPFTGPPIHPTTEERLTALHAKLQDGLQTPSTTSLTTTDMQTMEERLSRIAVSFGNHEAEDAEKRMRVASLQKIVVEEAARLREIETRGFVQPLATSTERADRHLTPVDAPPRRDSPSSLRSIRLKAELPRDSRGLAAGTSRRSGSAPPGRPHGPEGRRRHERPKQKLAHNDTPYIRRFGDPQVLVSQSVRDAKAGRRLTAVGVTYF